MRIGACITPPSAAVVRRPLKSRPERISHAHSVVVLTVAEIFRQDRVAAQCPGGLDDGRILQCDAEPPPGLQTAHIRARVIF